MTIICTKQKKQNKQNYLAIQIPISHKAKWLGKLENEAEKYPFHVDWRHGRYHITAIFAYDDKKKEELRVAFKQVIDKHKAFSINMGKVDIFTASETHVVYLSPLQPSRELSALIDELRATAMQLNANIRTDFQLHITLGEVNKTIATIEQLQDMISGIEIPAFEIRISDVEYKYLNREGTIEQWHLKNN